MHPTIKKMWNDLATGDGDEIQATITAALDLNAALAAGIDQYELDAEIAQAFHRDRSSGLYLPR